MESTLNKNLPEELWRHIIKFIPKNDRKAIPLVNNFFYGVICNMEMYKKVLTVTMDNLHDRMLLWSKRKVKSIDFHQITMNEINMIAMLSIMEVHGIATERLKISNELQPIILIPSNLLTSILQQTPHLKHLEWDVQNVRFIRWFYEPVLPELKYLRLNCDNFLNVEFASFLTPNTIEQLTIMSNWKYLKMLTLRQPSIRNLEVNFAINTQDDINFFNDLKLEVLLIQSRSNRNVNELNVMDLAQRHPELEKIRIFGAPSSPELVRAYCEMKNLKYLHVNVNENNLNELNLLSQLPNLKEIIFDLYLFEIENFIQVTTIKLVSAEYVKIKDREFSTFDKVLFLETAGINWPNVKHLRIDVPVKFDMGVDLLNEYFDNFENLETLQLRSNPDYAIDPEELDGDGETLQNMFNFLTYFQQYPRLKKLYIIGANINHFEDLIGALPNLQILVIDYRYGIDYTLKCLHQLLQLDKLENVDLKFSTKSSIFRFNDQDAAMLKLLCRRLKDFKIEFIGIQEFLAKFRSLIESCKFVDVKSTGWSVTLSNIAF